MLNKNNLDFHPKFVDPFYIRLMGFGFMQEEHNHDPLTFLNSIKDLRRELSNNEILTMLNHNWRPSKVGAWIIGLSKISELKKNLIESLKNQPIYCEHIIINLVLFNTEDGNNAINKHLLNQLQSMLDYSLAKKEYKAIDIYDRNSILWAFGAIKYLDSLNSTDNYNVLINSVVWNSIKKEWSLIEKTNPRATGFLKILEELENVDLGFEKAMKTIKKVIDNGK